MDFATVKSIAQSLHGTLQCSELKELCSAWKYESELEKLERTVSTIKAVILDAEAKHEQQQFSHQKQLWVKELKDALYDADDLFDELSTVAEQKQLMVSDMEGGNLSKKVRLFFSRFNPLVLAVKMSRGVKQTRDKLDAIANNHSQFSFNLNSQPTHMERQETYSFVYSNNIIGREDDTEKIVSMLLGSDVTRHVSFLSIVGIGGLGKTTLAQLVCNHPVVKKEFALRLWISVADVHQKDLDVMRIFIKIMESVTKKRCSAYDMDRLQKESQKQLAGKKYFLVLDDVWSENRDTWLRLEEFLIMMGGLNGSWIIVTTRSSIVARVVGDGLTYDLKGLPEEDSWCLFERVAFGQRCERENSPDLVKIGKEIVKRCANVPLAIRVVGSLLYGHSKEKWLLFLEVGIGSIKQDEGAIEPILKLSYDYLDSSLQACFSYCALFPKDFVLKKEMLISLWIAQGYVVPSVEGQSIEDAAEEYFSILLRRCFFHCANTDEYGEIVSCKMHDLMHDIAQEVAGEEICAANNATVFHHCMESNAKVDLYKGVRHVSHGDPIVFALCQVNPIRTYLRVTGNLSLSSVEFLQYWRLRALDLSYLETTISLNVVGKLLHLRYLDLSGNRWLRTLPRSIVQLRHLQILKLGGNHTLNKLPKDLCKLDKLRLLDLNGLSILSLPNSLGNLLHLAHIDLSGNDRLRKLPGSIMELHDLRTLRLRCCDKLRELPNDLSKLVKLRVLDVTGCWRLNAMPPGVGKLSCLHTLPLFVVGDKNSNRKWRAFDQLADLKALESLNGHLKILFKLSQTATFLEGYSREGGYLRNKHDLSHIIIDFGVRPGVVNYEEALLEGLQPHPNLKGLELSGYCGKKMPSWAREYDLNLLPNLVKIRLVSCDGLQSLAPLGKLCYLKSLIVEHLSDLEYIENTSSRSSNDAGSSKSEKKSFFPSLEELRLEDLPKLKGWWSDGKIVHRSRSQECRLLPSFPRLLQLHMWRCPNLSCIPLCPTTEKLTLGKSNRILHIMESNCVNSTLRSVYTEDIGCLDLALSVETFQCLGQMEIRDDEVESLSEASEFFKRCSSSLRSLVIDRCPGLRSLCGGLEYLTSLETLHLIYLPNLKLSANEYEEKDDDGMPWQCLSQRLHSLSFEGLPELVTLPRGMQYLSALQSLFIRNCEKFYRLPRSTQKLISLKQLEITDCSPRLKERCRKSVGIDWPNIQHIPQIVITKEDDADSNEDNDSEYSSENDSRHSFSDGFDDL